LAEADKLVGEFGNSLNREQFDYISASIAEQTRKRSLRNHIRNAVTVGFALLAIAAGVFAWVAMSQKHEAERVTARLHEQLHEASWGSFNQAEHQFQLGEWREGIALLAPAIMFNPENVVASERFFQELIIHREKALPPFTTSFSHQDVVNEAVFSRDGSRILTASRDNTAKLWDAASGKLVASFARGNSLYSARFSPDGTRILTASADNTAKLWDTASGNLIVSLAHQGAVEDAVFSPDGVRILTASWDKTAKLWDAASGRLIASFAHQDGIIRAAFSPDGARVLTGSWDKTAKLWDAASGKLIASFAHQDRVNNVLLSPDGGRVLTASWDKTAKLWDAVTPAELARWMKESGGARAGRTASDFDCRLPRVANRVTFRHRKWTPILKRRLAGHSQ
jgi:hypothetical protein